MSSFIRHSTPPPGRRGAPRAGPGRTPLPAPPAALWGAQAPLPSRSPPPPSLPRSCSAAVGAGCCGGGGPAPSSWRPLPGPHRPRPAPPGPSVWPAESGVHCAGRGRPPPQPQARDGDSVTESEPPPRARPPPAHAPAERRPPREEQPPPPPPEELRRESGRAGGQRGAAESASSTGPALPPPPPGDVPRGGRCGRAGRAPLLVGSPGHSALLLALSHGVPPSRLRDRGEWPRAAPLALPGRPEPRAAGAAGSRPGGGPAGRAARTGRRAGVRARTLPAASARRACSGRRRGGGRLLWERGRRSPGLRALLRGGGSGAPAAVAGGAPGGALRRESWDSAIIRWCPSPRSGRPSLCRTSRAPLSPRAVAVAARTARSRPEGPRRALWGRAGPAPGAGRAAGVGGRGRRPPLRFRVIFGGLWGP